MYSLLVCPVFILAVLGPAVCWSSPSSTTSSSSSSSSDSAAPISAVTQTMEGHPTIQGLALAYEEIGFAIRDLARPGPCAFPPEAIVARMENISSAADGAPPGALQGPVSEAEQFALIPLQLTFALELARRNDELARGANYFLAGGGLGPRIETVLANERKNLEGFIADVAEFAPVTAAPLRGITQAAVDATDKAIAAFSG